MKLVTIFKKLKQSLSTPSNLRVFAETAPRHAALAGYASPRAVLDALGPASALTICERDAILVAILDEVRATKASLWQAVVVVAFEPMLVRIRTRLGQPKVTRFGRSESDDLDQRVLLAILEAASAKRVTSHAARVLRLGVMERVFGEEEAEREAFGPDEFDDDTYEVDPLAVTTRDKAAANEVLRIVEVEGGAELRDMMVATRAHGEPLRDYVTRVYADRGLTERRTIERRLAADADRIERKLRELEERPQHRRFVEPARRK
jgi:hypothetical protein